MSLKIKTTNKTEIFDIGDDAKLHYRYLDPLEQMRFMRSYGRNAKMTEEESVEMSYDLMLKMVTGWEGIENEKNNKPIKFKTELIKILPMPIILNFITLIISPIFTGIVKTAKLNKTEN